MKLPLSATQFFIIAAALATALGEVVLHADDLGLSKSAVALIVTGVSFLKALARPTPPSLDK